MAVSTTRLKFYNSTPIFEISTFTATNSIPGFLFQLNFADLISQVRMRFESLYKNCSHSSIYNISNQMYAPQMFCYSILMKKKNMQIIEIVKCSC